MLGNRRVFLRQRVAASNNKGLPAHLDRADDAMGAKTPVAREENDLARAQARGPFPQNQKKVARKNRREHARAACDEPQFAKCTQDLGRKRQFYCGPGFRSSRRRQRSH
jgi:hypothetical protein